MADDQKKVFKEVCPSLLSLSAFISPRARLRDFFPPQTLKKMGEARKISDTEQRKSMSQTLDKSARLACAPAPLPPLGMGWAGTAT